MRRGIFNALFYVVIACVDLETFAWRLRQTFFDRIDLSSSSQWLDILFGVLPLKSNRFYLHCVVRVNYSVLVLQNF
jgi:hypothetical protein